MREGYKKTEVGVIPEDWEVKSLIDVVDKNDRYSFTGGPFGSDLKSCHYTKDGIRVIQLQNIGDGYFNDDYKIYTSVEKADELKGCNIYQGDIIIAKMADPVARACMIPEVEERYLMCSDGIRLNVDCSEYDKNYILYSINSSYFRKNAEANSTGSTRLRIGLSQLKELKIIKAPLKEQEKIAEILITVDSQIDDTEKLIEKSKELKQGLMQKLLTKGIGHSEFKKTEVGEIPVSWEVKRLEEICNVKGGKRLPKGYQLLDEKTNNPYIRVADMYESGVNLNDIKYVPSEISDKIKSYRISKDDLFISVAGTLGIVGKIPDELDGANLTENADKLCDIKINKEFLMRVLQSSTIQNIIEAEKTSNAQPKLALARIREFIIPVPSKDEQEKISFILSAVDNKIEEYENKKQKLEELKKGLMQQLLTGRIRCI